MPIWKPIWILGAALIVLVGCATPAPAPRQSTGAGDVSTAASPRTQGPRRIIAAVQGEPVGLHTKLERRSTPGGDSLEALLNSGLGIPNHEGRLVPVLAEAIPSIENGQWVVFPDGRMETTWKIRPGVTWHDGTPLTTEDLKFAAQVGQDRDLPTFGGIGFRAVDGVDAIDATTVKVRWNLPYIDADTMFTSALGLPLPKHILGKTYSDDKEQFTQLPYWTTGFIGSGPFQLREFVPGSHLVLQANERYVLGRPKVDEIEVRFILEPATLAAHILAGSIELTLGRNLSLEEALTVRDQWQGGSAIISPTSIAAVWPQFTTPDPPVILDLRFRRALLHAIDRQGLVDTFMAGMVPIAHSFFSPGPLYQEIQGQLPRYDYDVRQATQLIEGMGYARGADGMFRSSDGQLLALEVSTTSQLDIQPKTTFAVADSWKRLGVSASPLIIPNQRVQDQAYRVTFPGFSLIQQGNTHQDLLRFHSSEVPLPETNYVGRNRSRYASPQMDELLIRFQSTIPMNERIAVVGQVLHHIADQLPAMGLFYGTEVTFVGNRILNIQPASDAPTAWNAHEWALR